MRIFILLTNQLYMKQFIVLILLLISNSINSQSWLNWIDTGDETNHQLILGSINVLILLCWTTGSDI